VNLVRKLIDQSKIRANILSGTEDFRSVQPSDDGSRAIEISNWNNNRIRLKNTIAEKLKCSVCEVKSEHLSE
jgi:hypothetical protein